MKNLFSSKLGRLTAAVSLSMVVMIFTALPAFAAVRSAANSISPVNGASNNAISGLFGKMFDLFVPNNITKNNSNTSNNNSNKNNAQDTSAYSGKRINKTNIIYDLSVSNKCKYDVSYIDDGKLKPIIVCVHGGSWQSGSKSSMNDLVNYFVPLGYVVANVEYEMVQQNNPITGQIDQVLDATKTIARAASSYQGDADKMIMAGFSSGAQIAVRVAQMVSSNNRKYDFEIKAILDLCGACDLSAYHMGRSYSFIIDGIPLVDFDREVKKVNPMLYINSKMPATLVLHGTKDTTVPIKYAENFFNALKKAGIDADFIRFDGLGHGLNIKYFGPAADRFLQKYV